MTNFYSSIPRPDLLHNKHSFSEKMPGPENIRRRNISIVGLGKLPMGRKTSASYNFLGKLSLGEIFRSKILAVTPPAFKPQLHINPWSLLINERVDCFGWLLCCNLLCDAEAIPMSMEIDSESLLPPVFSKLCTEVLAMLRQRWWPVSE